MEKPTHPTDAEQTQLTEVPHIGGEPAPPPLPSFVQAPISRTSMLTEGARVADRPTTTDPVLSAPSRPRKLAASPSQKARQARSGKAVRAKVGGVRKWKGSAEDCRSVDLIDVIASRLKGGGLSQRALNIGVVAFVVVLIFVANWATKRPAPEQTNVVEIAQPVAEPVTAPAVESAAPAEAQPTTTPQEPAAVAEAVPATSPVTESAPAAEAAPAQTPTTDAPAEAPVETASAQATEQAPAAETPATKTQAAPISETAAQTVAEVTPPTPAAQPETTPVAAETPSNDGSDSDENDSGVEVVKKAEAPKAKVASNRAPKKAAPAKATKAPVVAKKKLAPLPAIIAGEPYTAGGPQDLDSDSARLRYQQETKISAKRGAPAIPSSNAASQQSATGRQPAPPKQGAEKTLNDLDSAYDRPLPGSK